MPYLEYKEFKRLLSVHYKVTYYSFVTRYIIITQNNQARKLNKNST